MINYILFIDIVFLSLGFLFVLYCMKKYYSSREVFDKYSYVTKLLMFTPLISIPKKIDDADRVIIIAHKRRVKIASIITLIILLFHIGTVEDFKRKFIFKNKKNESQLKKIHSE